MLTNTIKSNLVTHTNIYKYIYTHTQVHDTSLRARNVTVDIQNAKQPKILLCLSDSPYGSTIPEDLRARNHLIFFNLLN